jgi:hypothetical protein
MGSQSARLTAVLPPPAPVRAEHSRPRRCIFRGLTRYARARPPEQVKLPAAEFEVVVLGLTELLVECAKRSLNEKDFKLSLIELKWSEQLQEVVAKVGCCPRDGGSGRAAPSQRALPRCTWRG